VAGHGFRGEVLREGDDGYDDARRVWNGLIDRRPALIARCAGVADVVRAVDLARGDGIELSVRGTGHNVTGNAVCDGGLMVDLSLLKGIRVDPVRGRAVAQAGVTWGELDHETQAFGLATTGARISTTGIGGVTLGGGLGWLMRRFGLTIDNLRSADVVLADGRFVTASETESPDLFWALRGGGGNFGVVTAFEYQLHPVGPQVVGGAAFYPMSRAGHVMRWYRDFVADAPDELAAQCNFLLAPPAPFVPAHLHGTPVVAIALCHLGNPGEAERDLARLDELGEPLVYRIRPMPYTTLQRLYDAAGRFGFAVHSRSGCLTELTDQAIETIVHHAALNLSPFSIFMLTPLGGAVGRVDGNCTAFSHRHATYNYAIDSVWQRQEDAAHCMQWTEDFWAALRPFSSGVYVNELGGEGEERIRDAYGAQTYDRLVEVKNTYDPDNLFHLNQNIKPATSKKAR
jgi:FAD/FMN-containing dehydrogenase